MWKSPLSFQLTVDKISSGQWAGCDSHFELLTYKEIIYNVLWERERKKKQLNVALTEEENNKYYDHCEKHFVPETCHAAPYPQLENTLPPATNHRRRQAVRNGVPQRNMQSHSSFDITTIDSYLGSSAHPLAPCFCSADYTTTTWGTGVIWKVLFTSWRKWKVNRGWQECQSPRKERGPRQSTAASSLVRAPGDSLRSGHESWHNVRWGKKKLRQFGEGL